MLRESPFPFMVAKTVQAIGVLLRQTRHRTDNLMRVIKSVVLGEKLTALYMYESQRPADASLAALQRIERHLQVATENTDPV